MTVELWLRPWALVDQRQQYRCVLEPGPWPIPQKHRAALWLFAPEGGELKVNGRTGLTEPVSGFARPGEGWSLSLLPFPIRRSPGVEVAVKDGTTHLAWPNAPERPPSSLEPETQEEIEAHRLMLRAEAVWDRLYDVKIAIADPVRLWDDLRRRWTAEDDGGEPQMDVIVSHATDLARTLDDLDRKPRHILRRTHARLPVARVQELDRRAMLWLTRQPGETLAERAGDEQRILAVVRHENFDTLENRVLRSYAELAGYRARNYLERNSTRRLSARAQKVQRHGRRCKRLARDLAKRGVRQTDPSVMPNFVLQENVAYRRVWVSWQELLNHERKLDDLWRWQARSWEEFCAVGVMVALTALPDARLVASAPLSFRDEQVRGSWLSHDNPLGVFHLPALDIVIEIRFRMSRPDPRLADFGASILVRVGRTGDELGFLSNIAIWPLWDVAGGLVPGEANEIASILPLAQRAQLIGGIVMRPAAINSGSTSEVAGNALVLTLGTDSAALREGLGTLRTYLASCLDLEEV